MRIYESAYRARDTGRMFNSLFECITEIRLKRVKFAVHRPRRALFHLHKHGRGTMVADEGNRMAIKIGRKLSRFDGGRRLQPLALQFYRTNSAALSFSISRAVYPPYFPFLPVLTKVKNSTE